MSSKHRIVITGGGTGGHVYPALSVYEQLKDDPDVEAILYIGAKGHLEEKIAQERKIQFVGLQSAGLPRKFSPALIAWPFTMLGAFSAALSAMKSFRPTATLGTGGYASAPPLAASLLMGVPYAVHEPDAHPGLVNKLFAKKSALCSLGMEAARPRMQTSGTVQVNGNPVASTFFNGKTRDEACAVFELQPFMRTLLVTGGSQGAQALNEAVLGALPDLLSIDPHIQILHQVGTNNYEQHQAKLESVRVLLERSAKGTQSRYHVVPYINDVAAAYAASDLTVCRAGAMTIAEIAVSAMPAIFVPYPYAAQDHQTSNARFIESTGAARVIVQTELNPATLTAAVRELFGDAQRLQAMKQAMKQQGRPNAARDLAAQLKQLSANYQARNGA